MGLERRPKRAFGGAWGGFCGWPRGLGRAADEAEHTHGSGGGPGWWSLLSGPRQSPRGQLMGNSSGGRNRPAATGGVGNLRGTGMSRGGRAEESQWLGMSWNWEEICLSAEEPASCRLDPARGHLCPLQAQIGCHGVECWSRRPMKGVPAHGRASCGLWLQSTSQRVAGMGGRVYVGLAGKERPRRTA